MEKYPQLENIESMKKEKVRKADKSYTKINKKKEHQSSERILRKKMREREMSNLGQSWKER